MQGVSGSNPLGSIPETSHRLTALLAGLEGAATVVSVGDVLSTGEGWRQGSTRQVGNGLACTTV